MNKTSKKIGLITYYNNNFGSILQCYATKTVVETLGYSCDVIFEVHRTNKPLLNVCKRGLKLIDRILIDKNYLANRKKVKQAINPLSHGTQEMMNCFVENELSPKGYTFDQIKIIEAEYLAFIIGSDQIWNIYNGVSDFYFLKFTSPLKRIAFAISLGTTDVNKMFCFKIKHGANMFDRISVRENSGKKIIEKCVNSNICKVSDPTIMLSKKEWNEFCGEQTTKEGKIIAHFLNQPSPVAIAWIKKLSYETGKRVLCLGYYYESLNEEGFDFADCSPKEFIAYFRDAIAICTDSFHSTMLSIILEKEFFAFERQYVHKHSQSTRIIELLEQYNLLDRLVHNVDDKVTSDVNKVQEILDKEKIIEPISKCKFCRMNIQN